LIRDSSNVMVFDSQSLTSIMPCLRSVSALTTVSLTTRQYYTIPHIVRGNSQFMFSKLF
jgi:hypothetical protein